MHCLKWIRALCVAAVAGAGLPAFAIPLPLPFVLGEMFFNTETLRTSLAGFGSLEHALASHGTLSVQSSGAPLPTLTATADLNPVGTGYGRTDGLIRYSFEIAGPAGMMVPVFVDASGHVAGVADAGGGFFAAEARWSLRNTSEITLVGDTVSVSTSDGGTDTRDFAESHLVMLQTNTEYRVVMEAIAQAGTVDVGLHAEAEAFIDPLFRFADGVDLSLFGFHFADGIGNERPDEGGGGGGGTVPEPGALANAALALGLLALLRRNRLSPSGGAGSAAAG